MSKTDRWVVSNEEWLQAVADEVDAGGQVLVAVRGNSMNPLWVDRRDKVVLTSFREKDCRVGTVVLAHLDGGGYILHRIVSVEGEWVTAMGDGNCYSTERFERKRIVACVASFVRDGHKGRCCGWKWELYSRIWMRLRPIRRFLLAIWRRIN